MESDTMKLNFSISIIKWLDQKLRLEQTETHVNSIKAETDNKVVEVTTALQEATQLQKQVIKKTTTYYIGKAIGSIK